MAETTLYDTLSTTSRSFMTALLPKTPGTTDFSPDAILSLIDPSFTINWGHSFFISTMPPLQASKSGAEFVAHMNRSAETFQTWKIDITDLSVDTRKRAVVVRADFRMIPKGGEEVLNEILFWMTMDGDGRRLVRCTEFLDPVAVRELGARMKAGSSKD